MDATRQTAPRTCWSPDVEKDELLGLGRRFFTASGALLRYAREASYHVYILHQTVIVAMAFVVVGWHTGVALKYVAILVAASITTLVVYEILVRRVSAVRFLFGMKRRMKSHSPPRDPSRGRGTVSEA